MFQVHCMKCKDFDHTALISIMIRTNSLYISLELISQIQRVHGQTDQVCLDWLQSLKQFFINVSYHTLDASLTLSHQS